MEKKGNKIVLTFDHVGHGLKTFDVTEPRGFAIAGGDQKFVNAKAKIIGPDKIEVWSDAVSDPVAVRYAWADNPVCNLYSGEGLPVDPVPDRRLARSDDPHRLTRRVSLGGAGTYHTSIRAGVSFPRYIMGIKYVVCA